MEFSIAAVQFFLQLYDLAVAYLCYFTKVTGSFGPLLFIVGFVYICFNLANGLDNIFFNGPLSFEGGELVV